MKRLGLAGAVLAATLLTMAGNAWGASTIYLCLAEKAGTAKSGGVEGKCPAPTEKVKYAKVALPKEESEQQTLLSILPYVKYVASGVGGKPTIQFAGINLQIVNGEGTTQTSNGAGNLVIGYDEEGEASRERTGSHNLILGTEQTYASWGDILGGALNTAAEPFSAVLGYNNRVLGFASVAFGTENTATGEYSSVTGGGRNRAEARDASISGGEANTAGAQGASVSGGHENLAYGPRSSISGGTINHASGPEASVSGGYENEAGSTTASVSGGASNAANGEASSISGGDYNRAESVRSSIAGGEKNETFRGRESVVGGGLQNVAEGNLSVIFGGRLQRTKNEWEACGGYPSVVC